MGPLKPSPEILALAQALVDQLEADDKRDMLSRWMAHDLAAKMTAASAPGASAESQAACTEAVEALWTRRAEFPDGMRPFEDLESLADAVRRLDPLQSSSSYFRRTGPPGEETGPWLNAAEHFDRGARVLIMTCLREAALRSGRKAGDWAQLAEAAGLDARPIDFMRVLIGGPSEPDGAREREAERLEHLIRTLADFRKAAAAISTEFRDQLAALGPMPRRKRPQAAVRLKPPSPQR